ncbi:mannose-1-phosphate guanylyltransferase/mannose-6-phosphate isomerase [Poseidonibacter lekithochrous]|uniref:mannose-1-phosphate guanylyltransferase/mannose-6-phosphate isomerase n=1 Tax=Poseidonibacter TaxID=2321187 RepID=UPI001C09F33F|nr:MULTISPECIES: mannose-1-phosphate guanylyltransferase/mannose-6-phosphate isomerase [Poseidonibacter]MBU3014234.1 mannose-1-phosphate guanylyltransferase/mannose-6-phosphate isomerase [Poseidonibacter lekithochrous]MDO6827531.1 mannose-1-phosphate guanylyltransferase/mannose-6-phosphate isomerase [Poseidonibacter sp. 1_MG-2023]
MVNMILCGGNGTRLWPISRSLMPKQFVKLFDNKSLFQLTVGRNKDLCKEQYIISNTDQYFLALDQLEELKCNNVKYLLEPIAKNTAPAIALACMTLDYDEIVLVSPSDHLIKNESEYKKVLIQAKELAEKDHIVTFGIKPESPETGYGYIEAKGLDVLSFKEKPDLKTALEYLEKGNYYWNSGMFCFKAGVFLDELKKYSPKIYETSLNAISNTKKSDLIRISHQDMDLIPEDSIDYAVMEQSKKVKVVYSDISWNDLGSFDALSQEFEKDENGNSIDDNIITINSKNNFIHTSDRMITLADIDDLTIVDTPDALLITKKGSSQKIKDIVKELKGRDTELHNIHLTAHRPWGTYTILEDTPGYKIKRIEVKPGKRLSLQKHFHRNEHWIVVSGTATVTVGEERRLVRPNESTYIKMGEIHRLENEGKIPVILIEAQVGEYTGEDDILRIEDDFERE